MSSKNIETRNRILKSAWKLLESGGAGEVRMSDIAKAAGISRQALYLHFPNRADLLVATTRYLDEVNDINARLVPSRTAQSGSERLDAFIEAWGNYIPEIYGVAKALMAMQDSDQEAAQAWNGRMQAVREGCDAAVQALANDAQLASWLTPKEGSDLLWTLLSVRNWEQLTGDCGWSQDIYIQRIKQLAQRTLVSESAR